MVNIVLGDDHKGVGEKVVTNHAIDVFYDHSADE